LALKRLINFALDKVTRPALLDSVVLDRVTFLGESLVDVVLVRVLSGCRGEGLVEVVLVRVVSVGWREEEERDEEGVLVRVVSVVSACPG
jgi:hypothetical protein